MKFFNKNGKNKTWSPVSWRYSVAKNMLYLTSRCLTLPFSAENDSSLWHAAWSHLFWDYLHKNEIICKTTSLFNQVGSIHEKNCQKTLWHCPLKLSGRFIERNKLKQNERAACNLTKPRGVKPFKMGTWLKKRKRNSRPNNLLI